MAYIPLPPAHIAAAKIGRLSSNAFISPPYHLTPNDIACLAGDQDPVGDAIRAALRLSAPLCSDHMTIAAIAATMSHSERFAWLNEAETLCRNNGV